MIRVLTVCNISPSALVYSRQKQTWYERWDHNSVRILDRGLETRCWRSAKTALNVISHCYRWNALKPAAFSFISLGMKERMFVLFVHCVQVWCENC